jgi:hypothetical protein
MSAAGLPSVAMPPLCRIDQDARGHLAAIRNYLHVASSRLERQGDAADVADPLHEALAGVDRLQDVLDEVRQEARREMRARG